MEYGVIVLIVQIILLESCMGDVMTEKPIFNTVNGLKYVFDKNIDKSTYDEENSTIRMCKKDWKKFKKELGMND